MQTGDSALRIEAVGLTYEGRVGPVRALEGCDMTVPAGTFACLVGPSGCGKSTLLDIVAGLAPLREGRASADAMIELVGLSGFACAYPHELSGGMAQRVGIARALVLQPDVLLMDKPFAAVDAQTRVLLQEELLRITVNRSLNVLFVTHDVSEAVYLGDTIFVMSGRPGQIVRTVETGPDARDRGSPGFARMTADIFDLLAHRQGQIV